MYIDTNSLPADYDAQDFIDKVKQSGMAIMDPTKVINTIPGDTTTGQGIWSQLSNSSTHKYPSTDPLEDKINEMQKQFEQLKLETTLLRLKILSMEGKFTQEEISNIRKMIMSNDEASITLAETIIENA